MTKTNTRDIEVSMCVDCLMVVANGEATSPEHSAAMLAGMEGMEEYILVITETGEGHFSWSWCDVCLSHLGGTRFDGLFMVR